MDLDVLWKSLCVDTSYGVIGLRTEISHLTVQPLHPDERGGELIKVLIPSWVAFTYYYILIVITELYE